MTVDVGGAFLGAAFGLLLEALADATKKTTSFKSNFKRMESILEQIAPAIKEIELLNRAADRPKEETLKLKKELERGIKLVTKCSKVQSWNCIHRYIYSTKLMGLEKSIQLHCNIVMATQTARDVKVTSQDVKELTAEVRLFSRKASGGPVEAPFAGFSAVPGLSAVPPIGLDVPLMELKMDLFKNGVQVLVLTAPGGCGKTTLVKLLCGDEEVQGKFRDNIFFITVTKTPYLMDIVQRIFLKCGWVPEFANDEDAINKLEAMLRQRGPDPILLVLDDVWSGSESLVERFNFQLPDYKILVTSRSEFPRFGPPHRLKTLSDEDAMTLFCHFSENSAIQDQKIVKEIVKGCKGFPLALKVIGSSLRGQPPAIWKDKQMEFSEGVSVLESNGELLDCLKSSLDALDNKLKEFYMDLGSFPEDQKISANSLIDMWVELYNLDEDGVRAIVSLHQLSYRNLLNLDVTRRFTAKDASEVDGSYKEWFAGEVDGFYNEHFVTLHDILRDLVIYQNQSTSECVEKRKRLFIDTSGNKFPSWWLEQKSLHISARLLSISTGEIFSSTWCDIQPPEVEALVLNFRTQKYNLPEFIKKMEKLKVLVISNCGFLTANLGNFLLLGSLSNLKRLRLEHVSIPSLDMPTLLLRNLQKISLVMCKNVLAFFTGSIRPSDALPKLMEIDIDYCDDLAELPDGLCNIFSLKKLSITNCHTLSVLHDDIGKLVNLEVLRLSSCTDLLELPDAITGLSKLSFLDISDCCGISNLPSQIGAIQSLRKLSMRGCLNIENLPPSIMELEQLEEVRCDEETALLWEDFQQCLNNLRVVVLKEVVTLNWLQSHGI